MAAGWNKLSFKVPPNLLHSGSLIMLHLYFGSQPSSRGHLASGEQQFDPSGSLTLQEPAAIPESTFLVAVSAVSRRWALCLRWPPTLALYPEAVVIRDGTQAAAAFPAFLLAKFMWIVMVFLPL